MSKRSLFSELVRNVLVLVLPSLLACVLLVELLFRFVIPAAEVPTRHFDRNERMLVFDTKGPREGLFTRGRFAQVRGHWRINDWGWNSEIDYLPAGERPADRPLVAIIGDSYVNGFQVDPEDNLAAVLRRLLGPAFDVYSFGMPGAPLSQYLHMSRYVDRHFEPDVLAFVVVHNDFLESLWDLAPSSSFMQVKRRAGGWEEVLPPGPRGGRPWWMRSALMRYLRITLQSRLLVHYDENREKATFVANVPVEELSAQRAAIREATSWIVERIRKENPNRDVIFLMDAPRADLYAGTLETSPVGWLSGVLAEACRAQGIAFVDLAEPFARAHARDGTRFESEVDAHWNAAGHRVAALALASALVKSGVVRGAAAETIEAATAGDR
jgi:hypothetical protein